jgi:hypothetical protein
MSNNPLTDVKTCHDCGREVMCCPIDPNEPCEHFIQKKFYSVNMVAIAMKKKEA